MTAPTIAGVKVVKLPVTDLARARVWYAEVLGAVPTLEFPDEDGVVRGIAFDLPGTDAGLALRESPDHARGVAGFNLVSWAIQGRAEMDAWIAHLDGLGVDHSPLIEATVGYLLVFFDPDGIEHHLYTLEPHGQDHSDRPGYGRPVQAPV